MPPIPPQTDTFNQALDIFDRVHPLRVDADENLKVTGTFSGGGVSATLFAKNDSTGAPQELLIKNESGGLLVTGTNFGVPGSSFNEFAEVLAPSGVETVIFAHAVLSPVTEFDIIQTYGWGDYDGEFLIRVDGAIRGGGRTSAADRILYLAYDLGPIRVFTGSTITVTVTHYAPGARLFRCNVMAGVHD